MQVLHRQRVAQAEVSHVARALGLADPGEALGAEDRHQRIARQDTQHDEDDDRDADHRNHPEGEPTDDVAVHACPRRDLSGRTVVVLPTADAGTPAMSRPQCARRRAALSWIAVICGSWPGLVVPAIHALLGAKTWMPGTTGSPSRMRDGVPRPGMTARFDKIGTSCSAVRLWRAGLSGRGCEHLGDIVPIDEVVDERLQIVGAAVAIVDVVAVLPDVAAEDRSCAVHQRVLAVRGLHHLDPAERKPAPGWPHPAG